MGTQLSMELKELIERESRDFEFQVAQMRLRYRRIEGQHTVSDIECVERGEGNLKDWLSQHDQRIIEAVRAEERERINKLMAMNIPQKTVKKSEAFNDGMISGWYSAREFIRQALKK